MDLVSLLKTQVMYTRLEFECIGGMYLTLNLSLFPGIFVRRQDFASRNIQSDILLGVTYILIHTHSSDFVNIFR